MSKLRALLTAVALLTFAIPTWAQGEVKRIDNPAGGTIFYGTLAGQPTLQTALGQVLHRVTVRYGDRPQLGRLIQSRDGAILAAFFNVTAKSEDGSALGGLAIVAVPQTGAAQGAVLIDKAERLSSTLSPMLQRLKAEVRPAGTTSSAAAAPAPPAHASTTNAGPPKPAAPLKRYQFPDGSGTIGIPEGWNVANAQQGDVLARGPRGEWLRFGMKIFVLDPTNPQSRPLMGNSRGGNAPGNFVAVPYGRDPVESFKAAVAQLMHKAGKPVPTFNFTAVKELPMNGGGKNMLMAGEMDQQDGKGPFSTVAQVILSQPMAVGSWQMTLFQVSVPKAYAAEEEATVTSIFKTYQINDQVIQARVFADMRANTEITNAFMANSERMMDASERQVAGFTDVLFERSVVRDTEYNAHGRLPDNVADGLIQANPNRFEYVPPSQYIRGIDY